tara:strand:+ start:8207 stop:8479 length:273 start_codon:yes stop_codon:yes gene_type:complete
LLRCDLASHLRQPLKSLAGGPSDINHVHVVGAGVMGGSIAAWCAIKGLNVTLFDTFAQTLGYDRVADTLTALSDTYGDRFSPDKGWQQAS